MFIASELREFTVQSSKCVESILYPLTLVDEVNFRLTYDGPLKAASQSETRREEKQAIRRSFNSQLHQLWRNKPVLSSQVLTSPDNFTALLAGFKRGEFNCYPIVRSDLHLVCDLDILFLRRENPGQLLREGGDLDNRIKTLFDALRIPQDDNEVRGFTPAPEESLFFCLTEDDKLITGFRVTTDRLLEPAKTEAEKNNVRLIVQVEIKATRLTQENMGYFAHF
jgi:hypothetical protein